MSVGQDLDTSKIKKGETVISVKNIFKSFQSKKVLTGLSVDVRKGEIFVIIGPSGCGKSVLLKHIMGLLTPDSGGIYFNGLDLTKFSENELNEMRKKFGMLFQGAALFDSLTVGENISFGLREHTDKSKREIEKIVNEKLELVGMPGIADLKPSQLSGGMKKRVGLARAIAMDPEVLLYDEPTTGLDPVMVTIIDKLTKDMNRKLGCTTIVVTHDMKSAFRIADRIGMHFQGQIIETGTCEEIEKTNNPIVRQFIEGAEEGPITLSHTRIESNGNHI
ncbi:MAG TPA: ABC transporter ATP-binding protein [Candidatus Wallbacteria bacterium]|nr:ABC transporter ATP-binding protein [Candidatus Wallbacteria bacterium]